MDLFYHNCYNITNPFPYNFSYKINDPFYVRKVSDSEDLDQNR